MKNIAGYVAKDLSSVVKRQKAVATRDGKEFIAMVQVEGQDFKKKVQGVYDELRTSPNQQSINKYLELRKAKIKFSASVLNDFEAIYSEQLSYYKQRQSQQDGLFAKTKRFFNKEKKESDETSEDRNRAGDYFRQLCIATNNPYKANLQSSIGDLERAIGYYPGTNWNLLGAKMVGIGVLAIGIGLPKILPGYLRAAMLVIGACTLAMSAIVLCCGCRRERGNTEVRKEVETLLDQQEVKANDEIGDARLEINKLRQKPHTTFGDLKINFKQWNSMYESCFKDDVDIVLAQCKSR